VAVVEVVEIQEVVAELVDSAIPQLICQSVDQELIVLQLEVVVQVLLKQVLEDIQLILALLN
tara:strand:- start:406 stop:591 length:186 start_codon:yes stop_codon:yes gene_type:complete